MSTVRYGFEIKETVLFTNNNDHSKLLEGVILKRKVDYPQRTPLSSPTVMYDIMYTVNGQRYLAADIPDTRVFKI